MIRAKKQDTCARTIAAYLNSKSGGTNTTHHASVVMCNAQKLKYDNHSVRQDQFCPVIALIFDQASLLPLRLISNMAEDFCQRLILTGQVNFMLQVRVGALSLLYGRADFFINLLVCTNP